MLLHPDHTLHRIHRRIVNREDDWFETIAAKNGSAGQGDTFEFRVFDISRNPKKLPDYDDTELKTIAANVAKGKALKALFRPITMAGGFEATVAEDFGYISKKDQSLRFTRGFATTYYSRSKKNPKPPTHSGTFTNHRGEKFTSILTRDDEHITLTFNGVVAGQWSCAAVEAAFCTKMPNLCIVEALKDVRSGVNFYQYRDYTFYEGFKAQTFWELFDAGHISIEFRIGSKDYGTCFRMKTGLLLEMFTESITRREYEDWVENLLAVWIEGYRTGDEHLLLSASEKVLSTPERVVEAT